MPLAGSPSGRFMPKTAGRIVANRDSKLMVALLIARLIAHAERFSPWGYEIQWLQAPQKSQSVA